MPRDSSDSIRVCSQHDLHTELLFQHLEVLELDSGITPLTCE
jgi:hypothetical protein